MTILSLKLYVGHLRYGDEVSKQICINKRNAQFQYSFSSEILRTEDKWKPENKIWSDEIAQRITKRKITFDNMPQTKYIPTRNKTIMDYVVKYV